MHGELTRQRGERLLVALRLKRDNDGDLALPVDDLRMDVTTPSATFSAAARRSVRFSPMVATALVIASATVPPPG
jgi:hypothetical protein